MEYDMILKELKWDRS